MVQASADIFSAMSDDRLAGLAANDKNALAALVVRYHSLILSKARSMSGFGCDSDDLLQEGVMGLLDAVKAFSSERAGFSTFASVCIRNRLLKAVQKNSGCVSLEEINAPEAADTEESPENLVVRREHERQLFGSVCENLTPAEWNVLRLYLMGYSYKAIASALGITSKAADNAMQRARRKLKGLLDDEL